VKLVCLANSWRPGGRCVAGIDLDTGQWIRPVPKAGGAIPESATHFDNHELAPLDVIELDVTLPISTTKYQRENRIITTQPWKLLGALKPADVLKYCDSSRSLLHGPQKVVRPLTLETLPPAQWKSLELREVITASFSHDPRKTDRWLVDFSTLGRRRHDSHFSLPLTDPVATEKLNRGGKIGEECLLTLSLTEPIAIPQHDIPELCYKISAAVIEM
jgi:hypothetical protein